MQHLKIIRAQHVKIGLYIAYIFLAVFTLFHHELWRDEMHVFLLCRDSQSLTQLLSNFGYDGHTFLWYLSVYVVTLFTHNPIGMQLLHITIASCTAWVVIFRSPFTLIQKCMLLFGYYFLFEYAVISRDYAYAVLFVCLFCVAYTSQNKHSIIYSCVCLFLLAQTSIYGVLLALCMGVLAISYVFKNRVPATKTIFCIIIVVTGIVLAIAQLIPPPDAGMATIWNTKLDLTVLRQSLSIIYKSILVLPQPQLHFWNSHLFDNLSNIVSIGIALLILFVTLFALRANSAVCLTFLAAVVAIVLFTYIKYAGYLRHHGHIYLCFVACYWICLKNNLKQNKETELIRYLFNTTLLTQLFAVAVALYYEYRYDFSGGKSASAFLKQRQLQNSFMAADTDFVGMPICGYLNRSMFYPQSGRYGSFLIFDMQRERYLSFEEVFNITQQKLNGNESKVLYILNYPADENRFQVKLIYKLDQTIVYDEQYFIYEQLSKQ